MPTEIPVSESICPQCHRSLGEGGRCRPCASMELESALFGVGETQLSGANLPEAPDIPDWKIGRLLGVGGMGELWLGRAKADGARAAIKLPAFRGGDSAEIRERFELEAETVAALEHPNIVKVLDAGTSVDGRLFLATEYVEGCDLRRLLRAERLPAARAVDIFSKVCDAMAFAHESGYLHRDLKPSNILVDVDGAVKVADFGLAKHMEADGRTSQGDGLGTPYYLAPESMRGAAEADERADVYSLGVLLYEMLSGNVPQGSFTPISERCGFSKRWDEVLQMALSDDRESRTGSVSALRDQVAGLWKKEQRRAVSRRRRGWIALGLVIALAGIGGWLLSAGDSTADYHEPSTATLESPWENSLGMAFLPLPEQGILIAKTETRLADFSAFHVFESGVVPEWRIDGPRAESISGMLVLDEGGWVPDRNATPSDPGYEVTPQHPVVGVTLTDAWAFCTWLTMKERAEGRIGESQRYRLPSVWEWRSGADGEEDLIEESNYAGTEARVGSWPETWPVGGGVDPHPRAAPVGVVQKNDLGVIGLGGNVAEWVLPERAMGDDPDTAAARFAGRSWADPPQAKGRGRAEPAPRPGYRRSDIGFRIVLELGSEE